MVQRTDAARAYEHLVVALHRETRANRGDDPEADAIRDRMDEPWSELTAEERASLGWVSEDLYEIGGARLPLQAAALTPEEKTTLLQNAKMALIQRNFARTAELLRKVEPDVLRVDVRAYMLGRCWKELGFPYAAAEFFDHAYAIGRRANYAVMALNALTNAGEREEVTRRVEAIERQEDAEPALLLRAAALLFSTAEGAPQANAPALFRRVIALVERGAEGEGVVPSLRAAALIAGGLSYEHLGDAQKALLTFDRAVRIHENDAALVARGMAQLLTSRAMALADFQRAICLGTTLPWPYLYLAHDALVGGRFQRLEELCAEGAARAHTPTTRAQFFEWSAIAAAQLGRRPAVVRERFARALAEAPFEVRIVTNADAYEAALAEPVEEPQAFPWRLPEPPVAQARRSVARSTVRTLEAVA